MPRPRRQRNTSITNGTVAGSDLLQLVALKTAVFKGKPIPKRFLSRVLSPETIELSQKLAMPAVIALQDHLVHKGFTTDDPQVLRVALAAATDIKDRVMGKPTERLQVASNVRVVFSGLDLERLPAPHPTPGGEGMAPPSYTTAKIVDEVQVEPAFDNTVIKMKRETNGEGR